MSRPPIVDVHVHVSPGPEDGRDSGRMEYEIWEYGAKPDVEICELAGTIDEVGAAMGAAGADHFVAVNLFCPDSELPALIGAGSDADGDGVPASVESSRDQLGERLIDFNAWALDLAAGRPDMSVMVAMDPTVLGGRAGADHLRWAAERGARGIKIHPVLQRFLPDDDRLAEVFELCEELGLAVLSHSGSSRDGLEWAEPDAFAPLLQARPRLKLILAHLGGGRWSQTVRLAEAFPDVCFDLCEMIAWAGAPGAPTHDELGRMILDIGPERVMFGTDFPWYQVDRTIDQVMALPHLAEEQREGILGVNAVRQLGLPIPL